MKPTKTQIIEELSRDKELIQTCSNIAKKDPGCLKGDLYQELFLQLLEMPAARIEDMHERGFLRWYIIRLLLTAYTSPRSSFNIKHRPQHEERWFDFTLLEDLASDDYDSDREQKLLAMEAELSAMKASGDASQWFTAEIFERYHQAGSSYKLSEQTGISPRTIQKSVRRAKTHLKEKIDSQARRTIYLSGNTMTPPKAVSRTSGPANKPQDKNPIH